MAELVLAPRQYLELEKLAVGAFRPLDGFMDETQFRAVVDTMRLPNGEPFPVPVVLDLTDDQAATARGQPLVTLVYGGQEIAQLRSQGLFTCDMAATARKIFGTDSCSHPGVRFFLEGGHHFLGGQVEMRAELAQFMAPWELTPTQSRRLFSERGWQTVAGFQTRNVPHRAHEYLQRVVLEQLDGLFVQPLVGRKKKGDYTAEAIMAGYHALIDGFYPKSRVVLGCLSTAMRYAGPREAVFHAIIRRNYGCTHFIVGRDHAGVGGFYGLYDAHELTRQFEGELGIEIIRLHGPYFCERCGGVVTEHSCPHHVTAPECVMEISGTAVRSALAAAQAPDPRIVRPEVVAALSDITVFITEDRE